MTREEILAMVPGRKLDALVAEKVMGCTVLNRPNNDEELPYRANYYVLPNGNNFRPVNFWNPSFQIDDAWDVVEKITRKSEQDGCGPVVELTHDGVWHMKIGLNRAVAKNAPEAICKCALLAVMEAIDE